jgi:DNA-binding response OmpR family regulator
MDGRVQGRRILIVEDDFLLAADAQMILEREGVIVVGPASGVDDALEIIAATDIDAAILDVELDAEDAFSVADALMQKAIPCIFASGVDRDRIPERFEGYRLIPKPAEIRLITESLFGRPH